MYKALRDSYSNKSNPHKLTKTESVQTSKQIRAYLLCRGCEERFNKQGENWVLCHFLKENGNFELETLLKSKPPIKTYCSLETLYYASLIPEINIEALSYFAMSVFWRGSIHTWPNEKKIAVPLGPYSEQIRKYLHGESTFPEHICLLVFIRQDKNFNRAACFPWGGRTKEGYKYHFSIPGIAFTLLVGKSISPSSKKLCFINGERNPIIGTPFLDQFLYEHAVKMKISATS